jgi:histone-lysine N-methyltransferase SETMAR
VPPGQTVNAKFYHDVLRRLREDMRRKRPDNWVLHHHNAPAHTALAVQHFLASKSMTDIPHPPYSPDLASRDFSLFHKMKIKLKGRRFDTVEEIQAESQKVLNTLTQKDFQDNFRSWQKRWDRYVHS